MVFLILSQALYSIHPAGPHGPLVTADCPGTAGAFTIMSSTGDRTVWYELLPPLMPPSLTTVQKFARWKKSAYCSLICFPSPPCSTSSSPRLLYPLPDPSFFPKLWKIGDRPATSSTLWVFPSPSLRHGLGVVGSNTTGPSLP